MSGQKESVEEEAAGDLCATAPVGDVDDCHGGQIKAGEVDHDECSVLAPEGDEDEYAGGGLQGPTDPDPDICNYQAYWEIKDTDECVDWDMEGTYTVDDCSTSAADDCHSDPNSMHPATQEGGDNCLLAASDPNEADEDVSMTCLLLIVPESGDECAWNLAAPLPAGADICVGLWWADPLCGGDRCGEKAVPVDNDPDVPDQPEP